MSAQMRINTKMRWEPVVPLKRGSSVAPRTAESVIAGSDDDDAWMNDQGARDMKQERFEDQPTIQVWFLQALRKSRLL